MWKVMVKSLLKLHSSFTKMACMDIVKPARILAIHTIYNSLMP